MFEEADGTEVEDDLCLREYDKGALFVLGTKWIARPAGTACKSSEASQTVTCETNTNLEVCPQEHAADLFPEFPDVNKRKTEELATSWQDQVEIENYSNEEDIFCTAETSEYTIMYPDLEMI